MALADFTCAHCGGVGKKKAGSINRAKNGGMLLFCNRRCFGLSRRSPSPLSDAEKRAAKRLYDKEHRAKNIEWIKARKQEYFAATYDPATAAAYRKARMPRHVEYCRRPEYREWKSGYDAKRRAVKAVGPFWESFMLALAIRKECLKRMTEHEIRQQAGTLNKSIERKRAFRRLVGDRA